MVIQLQTKSSFEDFFISIFLVARKLEGFKLSKLLQSKFNSK